MATTVHPPSNTDSIAEDLLIVAWILFSLSSLVVSLRIYTRAIRVKRFSWDDWLMLLAYMNELWRCVMVTIACHWGLGRHLGSLSADQASQAIKYIVILEAPSVLACSFGRLAFAVFLLYIIGPADKKQRIVLRGTIGIQIIVNIVVLVQIYTQCGTHVTALWDPAVAAIVHCQSADVETFIGFVQSAFNSLCDITLTVIPVYILKGLQMKLRTKLGLGGLLCLSAFATVASVVKAYEIKNLSARDDFTWNFTFLQICVCFEDNLVIIAASIPTLRPLWGKKQASGTMSHYHHESSYEPQSLRHDSNGVPLSIFDKKASSRSRGDGSSEEHIFEPAIPVHTIRVTRTTDIHVVSDNREELEGINNGMYRYQGFE